MNARPWVPGLVLAMFVPLTPAAAHHAATEFDLDVVLRYEGVLREFVWANPHIRATLATQTETGTPLLLEIEGNSPSTLRTMGVAGDSLAANERVTAFVSPSRRFPESTAIGMQFVKGDGTVVPFTTNTARLRELGLSVPEPGGDGRSTTTIFGTWVARGGPGPLGQLSRQWPLTATGRQRFEAYTPLMSPQAQCVPASAPWLMAYSAPAEFRQLHDRILFRSDWMGATRTIFLDGRDPPPAGERFSQGYSVGHWEGTTLVIETTNFTDIIYAGIANGGRKTLTERIALAEGGSRLDYRFAMADPDFLIGEVSGEIGFDYRPDLTLEDLECDAETALRFIREFQ